MTYADYAQIPAMNWSTLKQLAVSPRYFQLRLNEPEADKRAYLLGRAFHCSTLEPEHFAHRYVGQPDFGDGRTTKAKEAKAAWMKDVPPGAEILTFDEYQGVLKAGEAIRAHRVASGLISGRTEQVVTWTDPGTGLACKARLDCLTPQGMRELKSTSKPIGGFLREAERLLYHGQVAFYHDGALTAGVVPADVANPPIICAELVEPFDVGCWTLDDTTLAAGRALYQSLLRRFVECQVAGVWPGMAPDLGVWAISPWAAGAGVEVAEDEEEVL